MGKSFKKVGKRCLAATLVLTMLSTSLFQGAVTANAAENEEEPYVVSMNRPAYASSQNGGDTTDKAFDGDDATRWQAAADDKNEWIYVDLGKVTEITSVYVSWEAAAASEYTVWFSDDEAEWTKMLEVTDGKGGDKRTLDVKGNARYVRITCDKRDAVQAAYGCSLYEFQVYGLDGLAPRPVDYGTNLALNQPVTASSVQTEWWMRVGANDNNKESVIRQLFENGYPVDEYGNLLNEADSVNWTIRDGYLYYADGKTVLNQATQRPERAVDGSLDGGFWHPATANANKRKDDQWIYVDLGAKKEIGRIILDWQNQARAYQIQVSDDAANWTPIYSKMDDHVKTKNLPVYANCRYVRIYCLAGWAFNDGVGLKEMQIFEYRAGDAKPTYEIEEIPEVKTVPVEGSEATYAVDDVRFPMAKPPAYLAEELQMPNQPVASNDWWQTITITALGEGLVALPFRTKYSASGLSVVEANDCWYDGEAKAGKLGTAKINSKTDFFLVPEGMDTSELYDRIVGYSDYSVTAQLVDANGPVMTNTIVKGGPYIFSEFGKTQDVVIYSGNITGVFDEAGNELLTTNNTEITADHFGIEITDDDNKEKTKTAKSYFAINMPEGTKIRKIDGKIKIHFPAENAYMSIGAMTKRADLKTFYEHGYAFVTDTSVTYDFDENTSKIKTYYNVTTEVKREGFSRDTMQCLFPHQYKKSKAVVSDELSYVTSRGTMKTMTGNTFETEDTFYGMVPQFTTPQNDEYSDELITKYLSQIEEQTRNEKANGDAYWEGKAFHPLALATLVADQTGNMEYRALFLERLRYLFEDWLTYSGEDDDAYFYYDSNWGTLYYRFSEFGANWGICDHHFTYGYFLFAAAVLATYDDAFYEEYKGMLDLIVRDFASPYEDDDLFCRFRSYDLYEGHSWAGGYADNDNGNNQEAGGESLFGWVGMYLWSIKSGNKDFRDASIFGFTTELNAVEQYWFNYDDDNWPEEYNQYHYIVGQNYGAEIFLGTFFDGNMVSVYGIHWLPVAEWITHYAMGDNREKLQKMYEGFLKDIEGQQEIEVANGNSKDIVKTTLTAWQHIFVPLRSQYDPDGALDDYWKVVNGEVSNADGVVKFDNNEQFNAYWFANNMKDLGSKTDEIYALDGVSASVYKNEKGEYNAIVWNPTEDDLTVRFTDGTKEVGSATVGAQSLVRFNPMEKELVQVSTPEFSLASDTYDDTQYVEISTATEDAVIYYTLDGSNPTEKSLVYDGPIAVSNTTTIKAVAVKEGYIDSKMEAVSLVIAGGAITTGNNIAAGKTVTASSGQATASLMVDGSAKTRWQTVQNADESYDNDAWCTIDLGKTYTVNKVKISWEAAYASKYKIQVSDDNQNWKDVYVENAGNGGFDEIIFDAADARYVRMQGVERGSAYGYSIWEIGVYEARKITTPGFSIQAGTYGKGQKLSIASGTPAVEIRYTLDGTAPTKNSVLYVGPITLEDTVTVKAKAFKLGMLDSEVAEASYTITENGKIEDESAWKPTMDKAIEEELLDGEAGETVEDPRLKTCLSYGKPVQVSSSENANTAQNVTDGSLDTGWSSAFAENGVNFEEEKRFNQWCYIDLGESVKFNEVKIKWITVNNEYKIQVSDDAKNWTDVCVHTQKTTDNKIDICRFDEVEARYVKMQGIRIGDAYGYSLSEMMVYFSDEEQPLGSNVAIGTKVTVSSNEEDAANLIDGSANTVWTSNSPGAATVDVDLFKTYQIDKVVLSGTDGYTGKVTIQVSADNKTWTTVVDNADVNANGIYKFDEQSARYVKAEFSDGTSLSIGEMEVYTLGSADVADVKVEYYDRTGAGASSNSENVARIIDGNKAGEYWQAKPEDTNAWFYIDLGEPKEVNMVSLVWQEACAGSYDIYLTDNISGWTPKAAELAYEGENGKGGEVETVLTNPKTARYVVVYQTKTSGLSAQWGCAAYEMNAGYRTPVSVERVTAGPSEAALAVGDTLTASCIVSPLNADNTNVTWESSDETVATVSDKGVIKGKAAGTAVITVMSVADNEKKDEIKVSVTGPIRIARPTAKKTGDNEITVSWVANANAIGYNVYRAKSQTGKYTKLNDELVTTAEYQDQGVSKGTYYYKVEAVAAENDKVYQTGMSQQSIGVQIAAALNTIKLSAAELTVKPEEEKSLTLTASPADLIADGNASWTIEPEGVAEITVSGAKKEICTVKGKAVGKAVITVTVGELSKKCEVTVADRLAAPEITTTANEGAVTLTWETVEHATSYDVYCSTERDGTYNELGNVTETTYTDHKTAAGTYFYKVIAKGDSLWQDSEDSNIAEAVIVTLQLGSDSGRVLVGRTSTVEVSVTPKGTPITWTSKDETIATVEDGVITGVGEGVTTIFVKAGDKTKEYNIEVIPKGDDYVEVESITVSPATAELKVNGTLTLTATIKPDNATVQNPDWSSTDSTVASVKDGVVTAHAKGTATIEAKAPNGVVGYCEITVTGENTNPPEEITLQLGSKSGKVLVGKTVTVEARVTPEGTPVTWESEDEAIATVEDGVITGVSKGTTIIYVRAGDEEEQYTIEVIDEDGDYVEVKTITIVPATAELKVGDTLPLAVTIEPENATTQTPSWSSKDPSVATVENGVVKAHAEGTTTITATAPNGVSGICKVTVTGKTSDDNNPGGNNPGGNNPGGNNPGGNVPTNPDTKIDSVKLAVANRPYGVKTVYLKKKAKLTLAVIVTGDGANKNVTYTSNNSAVASVNAKGQVKAGSKTGTATITATSVADPSKKAEITVKVVKKAVQNKVLKLRKTKITLKKKGEQAQIQIKKYTKKTTNQVSYKVISGKKYAKVDKYGVITAKVNPGKKAVKAKIRVTCGKKKTVLTVTIPKKKS